MAYVRYAACLLWITSQSITGVFVAQTTKSAVTVRFDSVATCAGGPASTPFTWVSPKILPPIRSNAETKPLR
jgi:hypothetical protein